MQQESPSPLGAYSKRSQELKLLSEQTNERRGKWLSISVFLGLLMCGLLYESFIAKKLPYWSFILPAAVVAFSMRQAQQHRRQVLKLVSVRSYYDKGIARLKHDWDSLDDGKDFIDPAHIYTTDLDLFGRGSLFQLLCSARTHLGRDTLGAWMKAPAVRDEVLGRREAVSELRDRRDLFESIAAAGTSAISNCSPGTFQNWVAEMSSRPRFPSWVPVLPFLLIPVLIALPFLYWFGPFGLQNFWMSAVALLAVEAIFAGLFYDRVRLIIESVQMLSIELPIVCELLEIVERERFSSAKLAALAGRLKVGPNAASHNVRRLDRLVRLLEERNNEWFALPSWFLLWGTQFSMAIDRWHRRYGTELLEYVAVAGEFEALLSLAAYAFEHPGDIFPDILDHGPVFEAEHLGHPLLDESACIRNDVRLANDVRFLIVSGSNMSGKSTFLRAVGSNAVLAWMGAPVRCAKLRISKLQIAAAIRVQDSITDGRSHFLAEMQRLRRMIDLAGEGPLLFLADEIMSGTNSHDRRIAAEWVVRALVRRNAIGLITTHDLTLTEIAANSLPGRNVYFEDSGEAGELKFDYRLRSGLLTHSNALNIVRMLGIDTET
ncbi:MAG: hypothetical protein WBD87_12105 [Candidatus Acidiferrales bacterium]